jgi:hypothetical protein
MILIVHEAIYNDTANHSILSEFQLKNFVVKIDSICHKHIGTQRMVIQDVGSSSVIHLDFIGGMIHFKHQLPTAEEVNSLKHMLDTR